MTPLSKIPLKKKTTREENDGSERDSEMNDYLISEVEQGNDTVPSEETDTNITVYDPGSQGNVTINGAIITDVGGPCEVREDIRSLIIASDQGEIFFSRSHKNEPILLSEIDKIEQKRGRAWLKRPIDMSSMAEMYRRSRQRSNRVAILKDRNEQSRMQRDLISLVAKAAKRNASDIHIIVNTDRAVVRFRVDGVMIDVNEMQPQYAFELLSSAFVLADASDTAYQKRAYQGARISSLTTELPAGVQSLRLQFNPLANDGRYLIMRILYSGSQTQVALSDLGYNREQVRQISVMSARPVGINVLSGPTGSGKSTTLKAVLEQVIRKRSGEINVITIEDPPEYVIRDAQQMPVTNAKTQEERSEAFTQAISAGLRSDPNVMMIGEIRDKASADLAVEGALSGHPIYASLHANTAMDILTRLRDMGIEDFKVFDPTVFSGLVGQRLVRQLCPHCRVRYEDALEGGQIDPLLAERIERMKKVTPSDILAEHPIYVAGPGCPRCSGGYRGRAVVAEVILPDDTFMNLMSENRKSDARIHWFENMQGLDLLGASWLRVMQGQISPIDVENEVALLDPIDAHKAALDYWFRKEEDFQK